MNEKRVEQSSNSIYEQTVIPDEIIIIDDLKKIKNTRKVQKKFKFNNNKK